MKKSVFIACSLDGFIARPDGSIDWLEKANLAVPKGEDCGYAAFSKDVDALVMGRKTFELVLGFEQWPYNGIPVIVLSKSLEALPSGLPKDVTLSSETPAVLCSRLALLGMKKLYIDGGKTIQSFLLEGLISEIIITQIPVLIGEGIPLFGPLKNEIQLQHLSTHAYEFGFVQNHYKVIHQ